jgi:hypothetical protein
LPFLAVPLALAYRTRPFTTAALAVVSAGIAIMMTTTDAAVAWRWSGNFERLFSADGSPQTLSDFVGITGWYDIVPYYAAVLVALVLALAVNVRPSWSEAPSVAAALLAWSALAVTAPRLIESGSLDAYASALIVLALAAVAVVVVWAVSFRLSRLGRLSVGASQ